jgi:hypothetical protein
MAAPIARLRWWLAGGLILVAALVAPSLCAPGPDPLQAGFANPPQEARLRCYWWWLNGHTDEATITRDLEEMKAKGYGGALLVDANGSQQENNTAVPAGPMFGSPRWRQLYRRALQEAARLNLELSLNILSGWNLGGPMVTPEMAAKLLTWSRTTVHGPADTHQRLALPPARDGFYRDIAVLAYPLRQGAALPGETSADHPRRPIRQLQFKTASQEFGMSAPPTAPLLEDFPAEPGEEDARPREVTDVTPRMGQDGRLDWQAPAGDWEILRIGYTCSGAKVSTSSGDWQGLAIDYMDRAPLEQYWREVLDPLLDDARPYLGRTLRYLVTDSWEMGGMNWTPKFRDEFQQRRGYDLLPYLPVIAGRIMGDRDTSNRFLNDFRRTIGDLIASQHYAVFADLARRSGLGIHPESGGPHGAPIDALETLGTGAFPQTEFWARSATHRTSDEERFFVKEASSAAHIYGKTIVAAEGMTSIGPQWEESLWDNLKPTFDQAVCDGLNRLVWHTFTSSPKEMGLPGQEYFAGTHLNPNVTWWNQAGAFLGYINRSQFLLQQGQPVSDAVVYYGDHVPNFVQLKSSDPARLLPGYDYDVTDEDALVHRMAAKDGNIVLPDGVTYRLLVLPDRTAISLAALRALRQLVGQGAVVLGPRPRQTTGLVDDGKGDAEVRALAGEMWGDCDGQRVTQHRFGKGSVFCAGSARAVLAARGIPPDFEFTTATEADKLDYVHRQSGGTGIYFVRNTQPRAVHAEITLRSQGMAPELWHPDSGETEPQQIYDFTADGRTRMPLWLEPNGSVFVLFRRPAGNRIVRLSKDGRALFPSPAAGIDGGMPEVRASIEPDGAVGLQTQAAGHFEARTSAGSVFSADLPAGDNQVIEGPWTIQFAPGWGAPATATFESLRSWTESADPGIRYYSGTAKYSRQIVIPPSMLRPGQQLYLDLGEVREIAQVRLNGQSLEVLWKKPFKVALTSSAKPGSNQLEIEITNFWPNRLIGDQQLPPEKRFTRTNITKFRADSPLLPSGLLGPVSMRVARQVKLAPDSQIR